MFAISGTQHKSPIPGKSAFNKSLLVPQIDRPLDVLRKTGRLPTRRKLPIFHSKPSDHLSAGQTYKVKSHSEGHRPNQ